MPALTPFVFDEAILGFAPAWRIEGHEGQVFVRSRTSEAVYSLKGSECTCPAGFHGHLCWHLEAAALASSWEEAVRTLQQGGCGPEDIKEIWTGCFEGRQSAVVAAMRRFIENAGVAGVSAIP